MSVQGFTHALWRKSNRSNGSNACVEVADAVSKVAVRDSKDPQGAALLFDRASWRSFSAKIKRADLDL
jgi:Domain of unknown function (DUF397)